jgi:polygalacturonase
MEVGRRAFLKVIGAGTAASGAAAWLLSAQTPGSASPGKIAFNVREFGAAGDGHTLDSPAINRAIESAAAAGGGTVLFPAGTYSCYSLRLKSNVTLYLDQGSTILAADVPLEGFHPESSQGYDDAEPENAWHSFQDYGHNHWHNSLLWGEDIHDIAILGPGLIWGRGLSRGVGSDPHLPKANLPGVGNKAIALKNCRNVILRDVSILKGGWFGILATGVDNMTIDNLKIDTDRDGMDIDCCRNVRVSNCTVNSPWDDGICPKSSYALGYARATENVTITNCYVTGAYQLGTVLDGSWKRWPADTKMTSPTGRIKCGTESNGGFKNITISNCVFDGCRGFALESVDGALIEDITFTGITMRDCTNVPLYLRLGRRMRGPAGAPVGTLKRIIISNIVSYNSVATFGGAGLIWGLADHPIEDVKIHDVYMDHRGGGTAEMASRPFVEKDTDYPEPYRVGSVPASGFYVRNMKNIEFTNVQLAWKQPDARPAIRLYNVNGADFFRVKTPKQVSAPVFALDKIEDFRVAFSGNVADTQLSSVSEKTL